MARFFAAILILAAGYWLAPMILRSPVLIMSGALGVLLLMLLITNFEFGLMLVLLAIPFSVQVTLGSVAREANLDVGVDDFFIFCLFVTWLVYLAKTGKSPFVKNPLAWPFAAYLMACVLSFLPLMVIGKGSPALSILHLVKWYEYVFLYILIVSTLEKREQIVRFSALSLGSAGVIGVIHLGQILYGYATGRTDFVMWASAGFQGTGILGAYYLFFLTVIVSVLMVTPSSRIKTILIFLSALLSFTLFYTFSRASYVGFIVAMIVLGALHHKKLVMFVILGLLLIPAVVSKQVSQRISMTVKIDASEAAKMGYQMPPGHMGGHHFRRPLEFKLDSSSLERLVAWRKARKTIAENFVIGTGYWTGRFLGLFGFSTAHNFYVTLFIETGIIGFLSFVWLSGQLIFSSMVFGYRTYDRLYSALAKGLTAGYIGILTHAFFGETFEDFRLTGPLWILCGVVFAAKYIEEHGGGRAYNVYQTRG